MICTVDMIQSILILFISWKARKSVVIEKEREQMIFKDLTDGKIYHTITYGVNAMGSYASQLSPEERWKVVQYVHQLQKQ